MPEVGGTPSGTPGNTPDSSLTPGAAVLSQLTGLTNSAQSVLDSNLALQNALEVEGLITGASLQEQNEYAARISLIGLSRLKPTFVLTRMFIQYVKRRDIITYINKNESAIQSPEIFLSVLFAAKIYDHGELVQLHNFLLNEQVLAAQKGNMSTLRLVGWKVLKKLLTTERLELLDVTETSQPERFTAQIRKQLVTNFQEKFGELWLVEAQALSFTQQLKSLQDQVSSLKSKKSNDRGLSENHLSSKKLGCIHYLKSQCRYGQNCRFLHGGLERSELNLLNKERSLNLTEDTLNYHANLPAQNYVKNSNSGNAEVVKNVTKKVRKHKKNKNNK